MIYAILFQSFYIHLLFLLILYIFGDLLYDFYGQRMMDFRHLNMKFLIFKYKI
jgi:hypothetical protein